MNVNSRIRRSNSPIRGGHPVQFRPEYDLFSNSTTLTVDTGTIHNLAGGYDFSGGIGASQIATVNGGVFQNDGTLNFGASPGAFTVDGNLS